MRKRDAKTIAWEIRNTVAKLNDLVVEAEEAGLNVNISRLNVGEVLHGRFTYHDTLFVDVHQRL